VKSVSDKSGRVLSPEEIQQLFFNTYRVVESDNRILSYSVASSGVTGQLELHATILINGLAREIYGSGISVPAALARALAVGTGLQISFEVYKRKWTENGETHDMTIAKCDLKHGKYVSWGVKVCHKLEEAELLACISSVLVSFPL
ncbi:2-isopropylmalate synthase, partial [Pyrenochaeta sp. MPI-SDFR-AT-0127]